MKKYLALCLSLCMVFTLLAGCGKTDEGGAKKFTDGYPDDYLRVAMSEDPGTTDVMMTTGEYMVPLNIYDTLVECDVDDQGNSLIAPALAESWV